MGLDRAAAKEALGASCAERQPSLKFLNLVADTLPSAVHVPEAAVRIPVHMPRGHVLPTVGRIVQAQILRAFPRLRAGATRRGVLDCRTGPAS